MQRGMKLLLAGLAAYGYYKYNKMKPEERSALKQRGRKFLDQNLGSLGNIFGKKGTGTTTGF